jgi:transcriptional regulator with XRE-family HTH domain
MKYNPYQAAFEQKLDEYIAQSGLNKTWIASKLGYHKSALSKWINGEAQIPLNILKQLCQLFRLERDQCLELVKLAGYEDVLAFMEDDASIFVSVHGFASSLNLP